MEHDRSGPVLVDAPAGAMRDFDRSILERLGHPVITCEGPAEGTICPLLRGDGCDKYGHAHAVVFALDLDQPQHRSILRRYRKLAPDDFCIRVLCTPEQAVEHANLLKDFEVWMDEPTVADLDGFAAEVEATDR